ncbi:MAG: M1 family metallopeptidase [Bacteroidota bacterium]
MKKFFFVLCVLITALSVKSQKKYTHLDSLKGYYSAARSWWDVRHYDLHVDFNVQDSSVSGFNTIRYLVLEPNDVMQIDLLEPLKIDSIVQKGKLIKFKKDGPAYFLKLRETQIKNSRQNIVVYYHGKPKVAVNPPWDGGIVWKKDSQKKPWISVACQGMAARVWFPNKDHMADEPDSADMYFSSQNALICVSNGRLIGVNQLNGKLQYHWQVINPINNYNIIPYIGDYVNIQDTLNGKKGVLALNYWVLSYNYDKAKVHFKQVKSMLRCFEDWFGPYPFYEDGYKLVEAPYLGMEHQSATAYGNNYVNGYLGRDLSQTGWGLKWDFIIVHESGHEWFGNNISAKDVADNWIHESFTAYSENLYVEYLFGKAAGAEYVIGTRKAILNNENIIGDYDVNNGSSGDLYYKGANLLHTIRQICNNDSVWKAMLRGLNSNFWHQTVNSKQIENYMSTFLKMDLGKVFDQYLRNKKVPVFDYYFKKDQLYYRWNSCIKDFSMPLKINIGEQTVLLQVSDRWSKMKVAGSDLTTDINFYAFSKKIK